MMRPMKLAGSELMFGEGTLEHLKTLKGKRAVIVMQGERMERQGFLDLVTEPLEAAGIEWVTYNGVKPDPTFDSVVEGAEIMKDFEPDIIIAMGGGSPMDAAKAMWVLYEYPEITELSELAPPNKIPPLRNKAIMVCIPTTSGSASEVSRSIVISDDQGVKHGIGDMEMMPDVAILDPVLTATMPPSVTAHTGIDALTHSTEAYISTRANYLSDILAKDAVREVFEYLPKAFDDGKNLEYREHMLNASMVAGLAFTNVSLGIVHSMAHTLGSFFGVPHGLANGMLNPYVIEFNMADPYAAERYAELAEAVGATDFAKANRELNARLEIPATFRELVPDEADYMSKVPEMAVMAAADGCTKTNPIFPTLEQFEDLFRQAYTGSSESTETD